ncbi:MAG: hypothetical protein IKI97_03740 [Clostridia bacterium]|nr:hypothetical protein [Clostridia bacterium]
MIIFKQEEKPKRKVYLLLTKFPDTGTKIIKFLTGLKYPHASIGLEEDMNTFYSFVTKGFIVEDINRYTKPGRKAIPCQLYEMNVSEETYLKIKKAIEYFIEFKDLFYYSRTSLTLSLLKLPYKSSRFGFFCSQFVAYILQKSHANDEIKSVNKYFSDDLSNITGMRLKYQGSLRSMLERYWVLPCPV